MYDIKIFLEDNGQFGARVNAGKEIIYGLGNNQQELMQDLKTGLELSMVNNKSKKTSKLCSFLQSNERSYAIKI